MMMDVRGAGKVRLGDAEREVLRQAARECFEPDAVVRLFGSRLDDSRKGGDIDLLIETALTDPARIAKAHLHFLSFIYRRLGEQKIDLLIDYPSRQTRAPIYDIARSQGVVL